MMQNQKQREIKFRCWDKELKRWAKVHEYFVFIIEGIEPQWQIGFSHDERFIIMQFTGLFDRNGKEIYESDILQADEGSRCIVKFNDGAFMRHHEPSMLYEPDEYEREYGVWRHWDQLDNDIWRVIGNIYETPELVKK